MISNYEKKVTMRKIIVLIIITIIMISSGCNSCNVISAGSYAYAEEYQIKTNESEIINKIKEFKMNNPEYCPPDKMQLKDGRSNDKDDHWYHVYFYYTDKNQIIYTWIRQYDKETITFAFVGINDGLELGHWRDINKDFDSKNNRLEKEMFEKRILSPIKSMLNKK
jgi:hypothetical protein